MESESEDEGPIVEEAELFKSLRQKLKVNNPKKRRRSHVKTKVVNKESS